MCRHIGGIENHGLLKLHCAFLSFGSQHRCWRMRRLALSLFLAPTVSSMLLERDAARSRFLPHPPAPFVLLSFLCVGFLHLLVATTPWTWSPEGGPQGGRAWRALGSRERMNGGHAWSKKARSMSDDLGTLTVHSPLS